MYRIRMSIYRYKILFSDPGGRIDVYWIVGFSPLCAHLIHDEDGRGWNVISVLRRGWNAVSVHFTSGHLCAQRVTQFISISAWLFFFLKQFRRVADKCRKIGIVDFSDYISNVE